MKRTKAVQAPTPRTAPQSFFFFNPNYFFPSHLVPKVEALLQRMDVKDDHTGCGGGGGGQGRQLEQSVLGGGGGRGRHPPTDAAMMAAHSKGSSWRVKQTQAGGTGHTITEAYAIGKGGIQRPSHTVCSSTLLCPNILHMGCSPHTPLPTWAAAGKRDVGDDARQRERSGHISLRLHALGCGNGQRRAGQHWHACLLALGLLLP